MEKLPWKNLENQVSGDPMPVFFCRILQFHELYSIIIIISIFTSSGNPLDVAGAKVGINFNKDRLVIPTARCHGMMEFVKEMHGQDTANAVMDILFRRYFTEAQNVHTEEILKEIAIELELPWGDGLDAACAKDSVYTQKAIEKDMMVKTRMKVSGVPFFVITNPNDPDARPVAFSGAQPPEVIAEILQEFADE